MIAGDWIKATIGQRGRHDSAALAVHLHRTHLTEEE